MTEYKTFQMDKYPIASIGPYKLGESVVLRCISKGGHPLPNVTWWKDNSVLGIYKIKMQKTIYKSFSSISLQCNLTLPFTGCQNTLTTFEINKLICTTHSLFLILVDDSYYQPKNSLQLSSKIVVNDVIIKNLERRHLNSKLTCRATNSKMSPPSSATVNIDMTCKFFIR